MRLPNSRIDLDAIERQIQETSTARTALDAAAAQRNAKLGGILARLARPFPPSATVGFSPSPPRPPPPDIDIDQDDRCSIERMTTVTMLLTDLPNLGKQYNTPYHMRPLIMTTLPA